MPNTKEGRDGGWGLVELERRAAVAEGIVKNKFLSRFSNRVLKTKGKLYADKNIYVAADGKSSWEN